MSEILNQFTLIKQRRNIKYNIKNSIYSKNKIKEEEIILQARIGLIHLNCTHLISKDPILICAACNTKLSIELIITTW